MKKNRFLTELQELKTALSQMSFRGKIDHLWTYYKGVLVVILICIMLASLMGTSISNQRKHLLSAGVTVNVTLSQEGIDYLSARCYERAPEQKNGDFYLQGTVMQPFEDTTDYEYNYNVVLSIITKCSTGDLDYMIMDEVGMKLLLVQELFMDLSEVFSQEELTALGDAVISARAEDEETARPVTINIADLPFIKDNMDVQGPVYFAVVRNSPRKDVCRQVWSDMLAWKQG